MNNMQNAVCWYKLLSNELGENTTWGTPGAAGQKAQHRVRVLIEMFFAVCDEMGVAGMLEIGAHNAESSKRFVASAPHRRAAAYDASPEVVERIIAEGLPDRLSYHHSAIGTAQGTIKFFLPRDPTYAVWGSTARRAGFNDVREVFVPVIRMDEAATQVIGGSRDLAVWIDVEGLALDVLSSGRQTLSENVAAVYVEVNDKNAYEGSATAVGVIAIMLEHDFVPLLRDNEYPDAYNIVFVHSSYFSQPREAFAMYSYSLMPGSPV